MIEPVGKLQGIGQCPRLLHFLFGSSVVRHFQPGTLGQFFYRFGKTQALKFANKADGIAMGSTAKAVIEAFVRSNVK